MKHKNMRSEISSLLIKIKANYTNEEIEIHTGRRWDQLDRFANWGGRIEAQSVPKLQEAIQIMKHEM